MIGPRIFAAPLPHRSARVELQTFAPGQAMFVLRRWLAVEGPRGNGAVFDREFEFACCTRRKRNRKVREVHQFVCNEFGVGSVSDMC